MAEWRFGEGQKLVRKPLYCWIALSYRTHTVYDLMVTSHLWRISQRMDSESTHQSTWWITSSYFKPVSISFKTYVTVFCFVCVCVCICVHACFCVHMRPKSPERVTGSPGAGITRVCEPFNMDASSWNDWAASSLNHWAIFPAPTYTF